MHNVPRRGVFPAFNLAAYGVNVSTKLVQNLKLIDAPVGVGSEHMRRPRLPLVAEAQATRPAHCQSRP